MNPASRKRKRSHLANCATYRFSAIFHFLMYFASSVPEAGSIRAIRDPGPFRWRSRAEVQVWGVPPCRLTRHVLARAEIPPDLVKLAGCQRVAVPALAAGVRVRELHHDPVGALNAERPRHRRMRRNRERIAEGPLRAGAEQHDHRCGSDMDRRAKPGPAHVASASFTPCSALDLQ
jgi:hypothetical protein